MGSKAAASFAVVEKNGASNLPMSCCKKYPCFTASYFLWVSDVFSYCMPSLGVGVGLTPPLRSGSG